MAAAMSGKLDNDNGLLLDKGKGRISSDSDDDDSKGTTSEGDDNHVLELHKLAKETTNFLNSDEKDEDEDGIDTSRPEYAKRARTQSISSISFAFDMLPIPLSRDVLDPAEALRVTKHLDLTSGIALVGSHHLCHCIQMINGSSGHRDADWKRDIQQSSQPLPLRTYSVPPLM